MRIIDFETHDTPTSMIPGRERLSAAERGEIFERELAARVAVMDEYGIDTQLIGCPSGVERMELGAAIEYVRSVNDEAYAMTQRCPGRFIAYANIIPQDVGASIAELERCHEMGFPALMPSSNFTTTFIDDDEYFPLLKRAVELGMFVYLHPGPPAIDRLNGLGIMLSRGLGYHIDICITVTRLVCKGVFDKLPEMKMILGHMGETLPFIIDRMDAISNKAADRPEMLGANKKPLSYYFDNNFYISTSGNFSRAAFLCVKERLGLDRVVFGTDFPIENYAQSIEFLNSVLTVDEAEMVYHANAERIFGL